MTKSKIIRRTIGIVAVLCWFIFIVPNLILPFGDRLAWQLDNWALIVAIVLTAVYVVMSTIHIAKGRHWTIKILEWLGCVIFLLICCVVLFLAGILADRKIWSNNEYVVYSEYYGFFDPKQFVLYKRDGLIDRRQHSLGSGWSQVKNAVYTMYEDLDLMKEEADVSPFESDSVYHTTVFYRLSDCEQYDEAQNDSLFKLIREK